jgi:hypothetical protein
MSRIQPPVVWKLAKPYWVIGKISVLVLGSLVYLQLVEGWRRFSTASEALGKTDSDCSAWDKPDIIDLP